MPTLSPHERAALQIFLDCYETGAWIHRGGELGPVQKERIDLTIAREYAHGYGLTWTVTLAKKVVLCSREFLAYESKCQAEEAERQRWLHEHGGTVS